MAETVLIAILAKDKAHCLPLYLKCLESQTWPRSKTHLYIRTNNNQDNTTQLLLEWVKRVRHSYASVYFNSTDVDVNLQQYGHHEWSETRVNVLAAIRQASINYAQELGSHYFVADCDNFINADVLERLVKTGLPVVGPLLKNSPRHLYANYHHHTDERGYYRDSPGYAVIWSGVVKGLIEVDVIHCTYLVRREALASTSYVDDSKRLEYVVVSSGFRRAGVKQYIDNRVEAGFLTFTETLAELQKEPWYYQLVARFEPGVQSI